MPLNPLSFDNEEDFKKALNEEGLKKGWTPLTDVAKKLVHGAMFVTSKIDSFRRQKVE